MITTAVAVGLLLGCCCASPKWISPNTLYLNTCLCITTNTSLSSADHRGFVETAFELAPVIDAIHITHHRNYNRYSWETPFSTSFSTSSRQGWNDPKHSSSIRLIEFWAAADCSVSAISTERCLECSPQPLSRLLLLDKHPLDQWLDYNRADCRIVVGGA